MARKTASRLDKRKEVEAAEALEAAGVTTTSKKKKATKKKAKRKTTRTKKDATVRRRVVWTVFSGNMKEEARFPYEQRKEAEEKLEQLRSKSKKLYFIQPVKEPITDESEKTPDDE